MSKNKSYLVIDLEMTCEKERVKGYKPEIIEIGVAQVDLEGNLLNTLQIYVKPKHHQLSQYCQDLTGITPEILKKHGIPLEEAFNKLKKIGSRNKTIISWGKDWEQFEMESEWKGLELPISNSRTNLSSLYSMLQKTSDKIALEVALKECNINPVGNLHSGVDDAVNTAKILKYMIDKYNI